MTLLNIFSHLINNKIDSKLLKSSSNFFVRFIILCTSVSSFHLQLKNKDFIKKTNLIKKKNCINSSLMFSTLTTNIAKLFASSNRMVETVSCKRIYLGQGRYPKILINFFIVFKTENRSIIPKWTTY